MRLSTAEYNKNLVAENENRTLFDQMGKKSKTGKSQNYFEMQGTTMDSSVVLKETDSINSKPDWTLIPSKGDSPYTDEQWNTIIVNAATSAAKNGDRNTNELKRMIASYLSPVSPDRKSLYATMSAQYGNKFSGYRAGGESILSCHGEGWSYSMTKDEKARYDQFMNLYNATYDQVRSDLPKEAHKMSYTI